MIQTVWLPMKSRLEYHQLMYHHCSNTLETVLMSGTGVSDPASGEQCYMKEDDCVLTGKEDEE